MQKLLYILFFFVCFSTVGQTQTITQYFTDRCTNEVKTVTANFVNGSATVAFYNRVKTFTWAEYTNGTLEAWLNETYAWWSNLSPCSTNTANQQSTQQTTSNATSSATNAASNATSSTTNTTGTTNTNTNGNTGSTSTGSTSSGSGSSSAGSGNSSGSSSSGSTGGDSNNSSSTGGDSGGSSGSSDNTGGDSSNSGGDNSGGDSGGDNSNDSGSSGGEDSSGDNSSDNDNSSSDNDNSSGDGDSGDGDSSGEEGGDSNSESEENSEDSSSEENSEEQSEENSDEESSEESEEEVEEEKKEEEKEEEESKEESEEESDESEEEEKEEKKEEKKKRNPINVSANVLTQSALDGTISNAASFGFSQSSLTGTTTYSANIMIWDNLDQFSLSLSESNVYFNYDREEKLFLYNPETGKEDLYFGSTYGRGSIMMIQSVSANFMYIYGTKVASFGISNVYLGQKENFWKGFIGGYALSGTLINIDDIVMIMPSGVLFGTKPFPTKRVTISPMLALAINPVSYSFNVKNKVLKGDTVWNEHVTYIVGSNFDVNLTQRFKFNIGGNIIGTTLPGIPLTWSATIGSKFQF